MDLVALLIRERKGKDSRLLGHVDRGTLGIQLERMDEVFGMEESLSYGMRCNDELKGLLNNHIFTLNPIKIKTVEELTYADMLEIADYYKDRSHATRNRYFGYLRAIFR